MKENGTRHVLNRNDETVDFTYEQAWIGSPTSTGSSRRTKSQRKVQSETKHETVTFGGEQSGIAEFQPYAQLDLLETTEIHQAKAPIHVFRKSNTGSERELRLMTTPMQSQG